MTDDADPSATPGTDPDAGTTPDSGAGPDSDPDGDPDGVLPSGDPLDPTTGRLMGRIGTFAAGAALVLLAFAPVEGYWLFVLGNSTGTVGTVDSPVRALHRLFLVVWGPLHLAMSVGGIAYLRVVDDGRNALGGMLVAGGSLAVSGAVFTAAFTYPALSGAVPARPPSLAVSAGLVTWLVAPLGASIVAAAGYWERTLSRNEAVGIGAALPAFWAGAVLSGLLPPAVTTPAARVVYFAAIAAPWAVVGWTVRTRARGGVAPE